MSTTKKYRITEEERAVRRERMRAIRAAIPHDLAVRIARQAANARWAARRRQLAAYPQLPNDPQLSPIPNDPQTSSDSDTDTP